MSKLTTYEYRPNRGQRQGDKRNKIKLPSAKTVGIVAVAFWLAISVGMAYHRGEQVAYVEDKLAAQVEMTEGLAIGVAAREQRITDMTAELDAKSKEAATLRAQVASLTAQVTSMTKEVQDLKRKAAQRSTPSVAPSRGTTGGWQSARASWYGPGFYGNKTASGAVLTEGMMNVAHKTLPFGTRIEFEYKGRTTTAVVNDRGPFTPGRVFDLGPGTATALGFGGVQTVRYRILGR